MNRGIYLEDRMKQKSDAKVYTLRRKRRIRTRALKIVLFSVLFLGLLMFSFVYRVEALRVKVVEVAGVERISAEKIYDDAHVTIGESLLTLPTKEMRESILEKQPLLKDASVSRVIPSRVKIEVEERRPFAYVTNRKQYYLIDEDGVVLEKAAGRSDQSLFLVESDSINHAQVGEKLVFPHAQLFDRMCVTLGDTLEGQYSQVRFDQKGIKLFLRDGTYVLLGKGGEMEKKIMLVPIIMQKLKSAGEDFEGLNLEYLEVPSFIKKSA